MSNPKQWCEYAGIQTQGHQEFSHECLQVGPPKMDELKPISHKEFNEFIKGRGFKGRNDCTLKDLKAKFGFNPLVKRRALVVYSEGLEPTTFGSMRETT